MTTLDRAREILLENGYRVESDSTAADQLLFENESVFGFVTTFAAVQTLVDAWKNRQDTFLRRSSRRLQMNPEKAWNAYAVFLCEENGESATRALLSSIEEDFHATRKIARDGVTTHGNVRRALAPLLGISHASILDAIDLDERLSASIPDEVLAALQGDQPAEVIADQIEGLL